MSATDTRSIAAVLLTRGRFNYTRDVRALLALPVGSRYYVQWGHAWLGDRESFHQVAPCDALYCLFLDHTQCVMPLRHVRIRDLDETLIGPIQGVNDPLITDGFTRAELELGPWPVGTDDERLMWHVGQASGNADLDKLFSDVDLNEVGVPKKFVLPIRNAVPVPARGDLRPWATMIKQLKTDPHHSESVYLTLTSVKEAEYERKWVTALRTSGTMRRWHARSRGLRWRAANRIGLNATLTKGRYVVRTGRVYRLRVMYFAEETASDFDVRFGIINRDPVVTPVSPSQPILTGEFELMDLPFTTRVTRRRQTTIMLGPTAAEGVGDVDVSNMVARVPQLSIPVDIRPRRVYSAAALVVALVGAAAIALRALDVGGDALHEALLVLGATAIASLIAYVMRPED